MIALAAAALGAVLVVRDDAAAAAPGGSLVRIDAIHAATCLSDAPTAR